MRFHRVGMAAAAVVGLASPSVAQTAAKTQPSVAGYLCTFAGKCDDSSTVEQPTRDAPETRGFRLARPANSAVAKPEPTTANYAPARPAATAPARHPTARTRVAHGIDGTAAANLASAAANPAPLGRRRADLMIGFELNSARISQQGIASARVFAQSLLRPELAGTRFAIEGHTDMRGGKALNQSLSARRAQAVADFLASQGVDRSRLTPRGLGYSTPLPGHSADDPANRRVEAELES